MDRSDREGDDLFLARACAAGDSAALREFNATFMSKLPAYLHSIRASSELVEETRQRLLEKLFVGDEHRPPKITQYTGRGALDAWVRVAAIRTALNILESEAGKRSAVHDEPVIDRVARGADVELEYMKESTKHEFIAAFREAMASLSRRDRAILRFTFVEGLTPGRIGELYGVHRTTVMRWLENAQAGVLERTRAGLRDRLRLSPSECDRIFSLVQSRVDLTMSTLLKSTGA